MKSTITSLGSAGMLSALLPLAAALGCAASQPAPELVNARHAYLEAEQGAAAKYAPDELLEARQLLTKAEQSSTSSDEQAHLGYLAERQARRAASQGQLEWNQERLDEAEKRFTQVNEQRRMQAELQVRTMREQLTNTRQELGSINQKLQSKDANLSELEKRRQELERLQNQLEQQLSVQEAQLVEAQRSRDQAEKRAQAAIESLKELAQIREEANETVITLSGEVLFTTAKAELLPLARNQLDQVAAAFKQLDESQMVIIEGHTDSRGADEMNQKLSQARAESVRDYLVSQGVKADRLKAVGRGEAAPMASNDSPEGRANNRRVEMRITKLTAQ